MAGDKKIIKGNNMIGVDIEKIERFKNLTQKELKRIFTDTELEYVFSFNEPYSHIGGMWCVKEAVIKALKNKSIPLKKIEVLHDENGAPFINKEKLNKYLSNYSYIDISISHSDTDVVAVVQII